MDKFCTVLTRQTTALIKNGVDHASYFSGKVIDIDDFGVYIESPKDQTVAVFSFPLVGIVQEPFFAKDSPKAQEIKKELIKKNSPSDLIDPNEITKKLAELKARAEAVKN